MRTLVRKFIPYPIRAFVAGIKNKVVNYYGYAKAKHFNKSNSHFNYDKKDVEYYIDLHNTTFTNERAVEIPIILDYLNKFRGKNILEIGNVISHYEKVEYDIVDKYEKGQGVINSDINEYKPNKKYDLIISISTFEHIGFDEVSRYGEDKNTSVDKTSLFEAVKNTKNLLSDNGIFVFTVPLGFNAYLDSLLADNKLDLTETHFLKRVSANNIWIQVNYQDVVGTKYNDPYPCANGLLIGIYDKTRS